MKKNLSALSLLAVTLGMSQSAFAGPFQQMQNTNVGGQVYVGQGAMETVSLQGWHYVKNIVVRARGASWADGTMEVMVNGEVKGTIHVPGSDPSYIVTIADTASSIQFRQISGGAVSILAVDAYESVRCTGAIGEKRGERRDTSNVGQSDETSSTFDYEGTAGLKITNDPTEIAARAIELVDGLNGFSNYSDEGNYLLPIKKTAAHLYSKARAHHGESAQVQDDLRQLSSQIDFATPYIEDFFERGQAFDMATELLSLKEQINALVK